VKQGAIPRRGRMRSYDPAKEENMIAAYTQMQKEKLAMQSELLSLLNVLILTNEIVALVRHSRAAFFDAQSCTSPSFSACFNRHSATCVYPR
jgi:hypothetical protein